jgi:transcriptional regulator GlxA family with amidase domain
MPRVNQSGYAVLPLSPDHDDEGVRRAESLLQTRCRENLTVEALADQVGMSPRTLARRFKAATGRLPGAYLQAVRIELAKAMLERDGKPIQSVSAEVGYEDAAFFRALFKRSTGMTPAEYRARFAMPALRGAL